MIHARKDYDRIQDPGLADPSLISSGSSPIAEDEPVFIVRAKDISAPETVRAWARLNLDNHGDPALSGLAFRHALLMEQWQAQNGSKTADAPDSVFEDLR